MITLLKELPSFLPLLILDNHPALTNVMIIWKNKPRLQIKILQVKLPLANWHMWFSYL